MAFLDEVLGTDQGGGFLDGLGKVDPKLVKRAKLQQEATKSQAEAVAANSKSGLVKNTLLGLPRAALDVGKDIAKGFVEFGVSAGEAPVRLLSSKASTAVLPPAKIPGLGALGPVQSFESKTAQAVQDGQSPAKAVGTGFLDTLVNDPVGVAFKPILLGGAVGARVITKLVGEKDLQGVVDTLHSAFPNLHPAQVETIAPHIVESTSPQEVEQIVKNPPPVQPTRPLVPNIEEPIAETANLTPSKIGKDIEANAIQDGLARTFDETAGYDATTLKEQSEKIATLMQDRERVNRIIDGLEKLPSDIRGGMFIKAVEDQAVGNGSLLRRLAKSPVVGETSIHASEMRFLAERNPDSPVAVIKEIAKARAEKAAKTIKNVPAATKKVVGEIKDSIKNTTPQNWDEFVDSITC